MASKFSLTVSPAYMDVVFKEGETEKQITVFFTNRTEKELTLTLSAADFSQEKGTGKVKFIFPGGKINSYGLSSHMSFPEKEVTLKAGEKKGVLVNIKNDVTLGFGGHYGAVLAQAKDSVTQNGVLMSLTSLIFVQKEGKLDIKLQLDSVVWPEHKIVFSYPQTVPLVFENSSNTHVIPYGRIEIKDMFGRLVQKGIVNESSSRILPGNERMVDGTLQKISWDFPLSISSIEVKGQDSSGKGQYSYQENFLYINFLSLLIVLLVLGGLFRLRKRITHSFTRLKKKVFYTRTV